MNKIEKFILVCTSMLSIVSSTEGKDIIEETNNYCNKIIIDGDTIELKENKGEIISSKGTKIIFSIRNRILEVTIFLPKGRVVKKYDRVVNPIGTDYCLLFDGGEKATKEEFLK